MGWDSNAHNLLTAPISWGDISHATGIGGPPYDLGNMIKTGYIKPMAKYKPVRSSNPGILSASERAAVRYGMAEPVLEGSFTPPEVPPAWAYNKPRGIKNTSDNPTSSDEWFRALDFDGYLANAVSPVAMNIRRLTIRGQFGIEVYKDAGVSQVFGGQWDGEHNLKVDELLLSGGSLPNSYIGFVFQDLNGTGSDYNVVVTNKMFRDIGIDYTAMFYPQGNGAQGDYIFDNLRHPYIPILDDTNRIGHTYRVVFAVFPYQITSGYAYQVVASNTPGYSLGFDASNRADVLTIQSWSASDIGNLRGTINSGPSLTFVGNYDGTWAEYALSSDIYSTLVTPGEWSNPSNLIVETRMSVIGGTGFIGSSPSGTNYATKQKSIALTTPDYTYVNQNIATFSEHIFLPRSVSGQGVIISALFRAGSNEQNFANTLTLTV